MTNKTRPVLLFQDQSLLDIEHPTTIVIPLSTNLIDEAYPLRYRIKAQTKLQQDSDLLLDQIRAIDNQRLIDGPLAQLDESCLSAIHQALMEVIGA